ncbi:MAG TPA: hypothetical protein DD861_05800 [Erythrobacter sp.]|nr:hypothetical protein [Erythrobacter sp.]
MLLKRSLGVVALSRIQNWIELLSHYDGKLFCGGGSFASMQVLLSDLQHHVEIGRNVEFAEINDSHRKRNGRYFRDGFF